MDNNSKSDKQQLFTTHRIILFFFIIAATGFFFFGSRKLIDIFSHRETKEDRKYMELFADVTAKTRDYYIDEVIPGEKFPAAYAGMLDALDRLSAYLDSRSSDVLEVYKTGTPCSTGIYVARAGNYWRISDVLEDSPAALAGIKPGDTLQAVHRESVYKKPYYQVFFSLLSVEPEEIILTIRQQKSPDSRQIPLHTTKLAIENRVRMLPGNIVLVEMPRIDPGGVAYLVEQLRKKQPPKGILKLIIDLRHCSWGDFVSFQDISKLFFKRADAGGGDDDMKLSLQKKQGRQDYLLGSSEPLKYKAVVIVNRSTVMYGELLAALFRSCEPGIGAHRQDGTARVFTIIGKKTPGMVSKLRRIPFEDGSSLLLSEGFFLINGEKAAAAGVKPHIEITQPAGFGQIIEKCCQILNNG